MIDVTKPEYKELKAQLEKDLELKDRIDKEIGNKAEDSARAEVQKMVNEQKAASGNTVKPMTGTDSNAMFQKAWASGEYIKGLWTKEQHKDAAHSGKFVYPQMEATMKALGESQGSTGAFLALH
jgi:hypothetical protein